MSDKIANFEDYVKRDASNEHKEAEVKSGQVKDSASSKQPVPQETMEIEIEDPFQFLNAEERDEYIRQRQKDMNSDRRQKSADQASEIDMPKKEETDEEYDEEYDDEEYQDGEDNRSGVNMNLVVRVASVLTGIIILVFVGLFIKAKLFDRFFAPNPDEATQTVIVAIPAGYTEKNDTVVVSGASSLNLRSVPSTGSNDTIVAKADEGTEIKRIAVSDDGSWALLDYDGQQLYGSMKYLKEK